MALLGALNGLGAVACPELSIQRAAVLLDGVRREIQLLGDLPVGRTVGDQVQHFALALGQQLLGLI